LSRKNLADRVFELRQEMKSILSNQGKNEMLSGFENNHYFPLDITCWHISTTQ